MEGFDREILAKLAAKKLKGTLSETEKRLLDQWLQQIGEQDILHWDGPDLNDNELRNRLLVRIRKDAGIHIRSNKRTLPAFWRAAAVLIIIAGLSTALVWTLYRDWSTGNQTAKAVAVDLAPGGNGAVLTLASGRQLILDSAKKGVLQHLSGLDLILKDGALCYQVNEDKVESTDHTYNTLSTSYGKQFKVILPDGTIAWLNAGTTLKYPTTFRPEAREVEMSGEVYFEVAKSIDGAGKRIPFRVRTGTQIIDVLGTHFDVQAYSDESAIKTTLCEGKVRITVKGMPSVSLTPGQQSIVHQDADKILVKNVDAETAISWTQGFFSFQGATIQEVMHQLARWYDVDVAYAKGLPDRRFSGKIYRNLNASNALNALSFMQLHFEITKEKITTAGERPIRERTMIKVTP